MLLLRCLIVFLFLVVELTTTGWAAEGRANGSEQWMRPRRKRRLFLRLLPMSSCAGNWNRRSKGDLGLVWSMFRAALPNSRRKLFKKVGREFVLMTSSPLAVAAG